MKIQNIFLAFCLAIMMGCSTSTADNYINAINEATESINKAESFEEIQTATKQLIDFERENREAIKEELNNNKVKQAEVDNAYKAFMQAGMTRSLELGKNSVN